MYLHYEKPQFGYSLVELLGVVVILGVLAAVSIPRIMGGAGVSKAQACRVLQGEIELQAQLWYRNQGSWPAANLSDIGADTQYFPQGLPTCPVDGLGYTLDPNAHRVTGHLH